MDILFFVVAFGSSIVGKAMSSAVKVFFGGSPMVAGGIGGGIVGRKLNKKMDNRVVDKLFIGLMVLIVGICIYNTVRVFMA